MVGIVMLTHNAPVYCWISTYSIRLETSIPYELLVVDNGSRWITRTILRHSNIDKLLLCDKNLMFAAGNNLGVRNLGPDVTHVLLVNSDIRVKNPLWLDTMLNVHQPGITALGYVETEPKRADGFCLLIDRPLYHRFQLDESFPWWWSVTKLQAEVMRAGFNVQAVKNYENLMYHYGGKSGKPFLTPEQAMRQSNTRPEAKKWFEGCSVKVIEKLTPEAHSTLTPTFVGP